MSFLERAKAAANDLAAKADAELKKAGISTPGASTGTGAYGAPTAPGAPTGPAVPGGSGSDRALRDLGVLAYLEATGRPASPAERERVLATLRELESSGRLGPLTVAPAVPGTPPPPPPPGTTPPPPPPPQGTRPPGSTPPPPPPSWA